MLHNWPRVSVSLIFLRCVASVWLIVEFIEDILNLKPAIVALFPKLVRWFWIEVTDCRNKSDFQRPAHDFKWQNYSHWWEIAKKEALKYQPSIILRGDATRAHQLQVGATTKLASLLLGTEQIFFSNFLQLHDDDHFVFIVIHREKYGLLFRSFVIIILKKENKQTIIEHTKISFAPSLSVSQYTSAVVLYWLLDRTMCSTDSWYVTRYHCRALCWSWRVLKSLK